MAWVFKFHPGAAKDLYKMAKKNKPLGTLIIESHIPKIIANPYKAGHKKEGILSCVWGYNFTYQGINYRMLYEIHKDFIRFLAMGVHDTAYRKAAGRA
ncbi:MAG: type II toxin-antitoxin system RelE/ParE family toxin [Elusimicrobia bacterium]|nr:type II toxin-antitoxin system RelE/ParE family toxin [Elusimicrobiota bacterium]